ncbi:TetR/AcrR family transcriptional regulator [Adhaeretor mobilis]|uniref:Fatty acid metabolism regulator protein n=1 Tax=Adhaeretor mobilis TaxID=1930276 RepID=A0A517MR69_9BACT|nr:TetR/AcrR family transcriptional regulator [Adhaeretor mobilis]QDS97366.1 Fatty acid metabolism regulator protein [Adhaeretor mobilis]
MLTTLTRKERERQQREAKILQLARGMLRESGYLGLSMDRIAAEMEYSKGTIYQHFRNKEEIILALANEALEARIELFEQAATWPGNTRERISAIGAAAEEFVERYPHYFAVEQIVRSSSIWEKTSDERQQFMRSCEQRCMQIISGIVRDALAHGDLTMPKNRAPEDLVFGLWSLNFGSYIIMASSNSLGEVGIGDPVAALRDNQSFMLDGYGWRPFSHEADYPALMDRVRREVFSDE